MVHASTHQAASDRRPAGLAWQPPSIGSATRNDLPLGLTERRRHTRRPVLLVMTMQVAGAMKEVVCVDLSAGGAYFASRIDLQPLQFVQVQLCSTYTAGRPVTLCGQVVYVIGSGTARPAGFAVQWQWARCAESPEPLVRLLRDLLHIGRAAGQIRSCPEGHEFDFLRSGDDDLPDRPNQTGPRNAMTATQTYCGHHAEVAAPAAIPAPVPMSLEGWPEAVPEALAVRYDHLELLGSGGHGVVFKARDLMLGRDVVLKFLKRDGDEIQRTYFLREARLAGSLSHQNIVQILDIGSSEGRLYYVMQHVPGRTLGMALKDGPRSCREALQILRDLAAALDHAHGHGILHRDVKPENVLLGDDGVARLFDFGLARLRSTGFGNQSLVVGTPSHMAPEQICGGVVDHRTDLYSLGVVAYELLTGHLPFEDGNLFVAHAVDPVPDPRNYRPDLPVEMTALLERALAKQPGARFTSGDQFLTALEHALRDEPGLA